MAMIMGPIEAVLSLGMFLGVPLGMPPLPEDPALMRVAPAECLWYFSSAGMAAPDPDSGNQTEQLLAEKEVQALAVAIERQILQAVRRSADDAESRVLAREVPQLVKAALTRPMIAYVAEVRPPGPAGPPSARAGLIVSLKDQADAVGEAIVTLERLVLRGQAAPTEESGGVTWHNVPTPSEVPPVQWGIWDGYLIVGVGKGEANAARMRLAGERAALPDWLVKVHDDMTIERRSTVGYLNVAEIVDVAAPLLGDKRDLLTKLGLDNVKSISSASGLDQTACVSRLQINIDGSPQGVFALLPSAPLSQSDLASVPGDALVAVAVRLDIAETLDKVNRLVAKFQPDAREEFEEALWKAETELGIDLRADLLNTLSDVWLAYVPKGDVLTCWLKATAVVKVKDSARLEKTIESLCQRAQMELNRGGRRGGAVIRKQRVAGQTIRFLSVAENEMPFAPAWCLTDDALIVGLMPEAVKAHLQRSAGEGEPTDSLDLDGLLSGPNRPSVVSYVDVQPLFRGLYPLIQIGARVVCGSLQREGFDIDISLLPSCESIAAHLTPAVSTWARTDTGFVSVRRQPLPGGGDLISSGPIAVALLLPAIQSARYAAREAVDMNNLKQLGLAFHMYCDTHKRFPANIYSEDGKPLLSWRVHLLPYIEGSDLYKEFHLDEPWDSPHNKQLIPRMPVVMRSPTLPAAPGTTHYVAITGEHTVFPGNKKISFRDVTDGSSKTLLFVRASPTTAFVWSKPEDLKFDPKTPKHGLGGPGTRVLAAFCDGSVQRLGLDMADETFKALVTRDGGENVDRDQIRGRR